MTPEQLDLDAIEKRCDAATDGPWADLAESFNKAAVRWHKKHRRWWHGRPHDSQVVTLIAHDSVRGRLVTEKDMPHIVDLWDLRKVVCVRRSQIKGTVFSQCDGWVIEKDVDFIVHARTDVPALVARVRALEAAFVKADGLLEDFRSDISRDDLSYEAYESWCRASKFVRTQGGTQ